jgi:hypothetical protein
MDDQFSSKDAFEFLQKLWNPLAFPIPASFASLNPDDIEKKIIELKAIENWLTMNLNFLQMAIKTLEFQKEAIQSLHKDSEQKTKPDPPKSK